MKLHTVGKPDRVSQKIFLMWGCGEARGTGSGVISLSGLNCGGGDSVFIKHRSDR